jgi:hypothetical protein
MGASVYSRAISISDFMTIPTSTRCRRPLPRKGAETARIGKGAETARIGKGAETARIGKPRKRGADKVNAR